MNLLHAIWSRSGPEDGEPALLLWGEDPARAGDGPRASVSRAARSHPFVIPPREVRTLLGKVSDGLLYECAEPGEAEMLWPTLLGRPLPSAATGKRARQRARLHPWKIAGLFVPPGDVLPFLVGLPREAPGHLTYGTTIRYWVEAASFCLGLLARQRIIPTVAWQGGLSGRRQSALWRPVLTDEEDRLALEILIAALPPVCRAEIDRASTGTRLRLGHAGFTVRSFISTVLDASLRRLLAEEGFPENGSKRSMASRLPGGPLGTWLKGLGWIDGRLEGEPRALEDFAREVQRWNETLAEPAPGAYRTAFRLLPPQSQGEKAPDRGDGPPPGGDPPEEAGRADADLRWTLEFCLQDRHDLSLTLPAERIWADASQGIVWQGRVLERPQDRFLEDLGRASLIFPPLERALETALPTSCELALDEAYGFLSQAGPLLEESGFGVLAPAWWSDQQSQPKLRLRLRPASGLDGPVPQAGTEASGTAVGGSEMGTGAIIDYNWEVALGQTVLTASEFHRLVALRRPLVQVEGRWFEIKPEQSATISRLLSSKEEDRGITLAEAIHWGIGGMDPNLDLPPTEVEAEGWVGRFLERIRDHEAPQPVTMGPEFHGVLRPYQERGVSWLEFMRQCGLGACLADDMGLGKTVQLIALLLHERREGEGRPAGPTLVLCPMSVVGNWQREIERFAPSIRTMVHHGLRRLRDSSFAAQATAHDVVISTYALAHRDRLQLRRVEWERLVLDETQNIKNPSTLQSRAVRLLKARTRVALTGTPIENRLAELWSILDVLNPGYLGNRTEFRRTFAVPIERYRDPRRRVRLRTLVQPFILRRLKTDPQVIRDLPEKLEMQVFCNLTREQATLYQSVVNEMMAAIERSRGMARRGLILATLTRLKQICNHPVHYLQDGSSIEGRSGKVARLEEMCEEVLSVGDRALVFTQFTAMGRILQGRLADRLRADVIFLHGGIPKAARDRLVERFQEEDGPPIFLLSLRAGGTGINLTAANHVFHFDRWWNPAVEDQATDRAFRIGQTRNVQVHKFVCVGTLEERIDRMILEKRELASSIVGAGEQWLTELDTAQLRELFALSHDAVSED
jgi:SNF2 family DNA or RNA helicase